MVSPMHFNKGVQIEFHDTRNSKKENPKSSWYKDTVDITAKDEHSKQIELKDVRKHSYLTGKLLSSSLFQYFLGQKVQEFQYETDEKGEKKLKTVFLNLNSLKNKIASDANKKDKGWLFIGETLNKIGLPTLGFNPMTTEQKFLLAMQFINNISCSESDKENAILLLREADKSGHNAATYELASILYKGKNYAEAALFFRKYVENINSPKEMIGLAYNNLAEIYQTKNTIFDRDDRAEKYYEKAIESGYNAHCERALVLEKMGGKQNLEKAFQILKEDSALRNVSTHNLARFYENGIGTKQDIKKAEELYLSISARLPESAYRLAQLYENGAKDSSGKEIIAKNLAQAKVYYALAKSNNHPDAQADLDRLKSS